MKTHPIQEGGGEVKSEAGGKGRRRVQKGLVKGKVIRANNAPSRQNGQYVLSATTFMCQLDEHRILCN